MNRRLWLVFVFLAVSLTGVFGGLLWYFYHTLPPPAIKVPNQMIIPHKLCDPATWDPACRTVYT